MISVMRRLVAYAEQYDLTLVVETEAANVVQTPQLARKMLDEIGSPHLKMVIDCANLFLPGTAHRENAAATIQRAFDAFGAEIALAHGKDIADSDGIEFAPSGPALWITTCFYVSCISTATKARSWNTVSTKKS